jgi:hypothetical protein
MMSKPIKIVCKKCRSDNVMRDAWAVWNTEAQEWMLGNVFDSGFCESCEEWASLEEVEIEEMAHDRQAG